MYYLYHDGLVLCTRYSRTLELSSSRITFNEKCIRRVTRGKYQAFINKQLQAKLKDGYLRILTDTNTVKKNKVDHGPMPCFTRIFTYGVLQVKRKNVKVGQNQTIKPILIQSIALIFVSDKIILVNLGNDSSFIF